MLTGLAAEVTRAMVGVLLLERDPRIMNRQHGEPPEYVFDVYVRQVAAEVIPVVGINPLGATRELALQCIAYGVASVIEYAEFPEQQAAGATGRGWFLKQKFEQLLKDLRALPGTGGAVAGISRATFPPARRYPDPFGGR